jgi:hypothetical protein
LEGAKKAKSKTDKPVSFSFLPVVASQACEVCFRPGMVLKAESTAKHPGERKYDNFYYDVEAFLPLLKYDHVNRSGLDKKLQALISWIKNPDLAEWLNTSLIQVIKYKNLLKKLGFLNVDTSRKIRKLSVNFFPDLPGLLD